MSEQYDEAIAALEGLYLETAEYIAINNLGSAHQNKTMRNARDVLVRAGKTVVADYRPKALSIFCVAGEALDPPATSFSEAHRRAAEQKQLRK